MALSTQAATAKDRIGKHPDIDVNQARIIADIFAQEMSYTNSKFDMDRFMKAAGF